MTTVLPTTERALLRRLAMEQSANRLPSLIAGLIRDGHVIWVDSRGLVDGRPPDTDTQYRIGSITKTFVAVLVMRLRDQGRLDLADKLDEYVPGTSVGNARIVDLLTHSSPLRAEPNGPWWERTPGTEAREFLDKVDDDAVRPKPTHVFHYSNIGFGLLGEVISRIRKMHWAEALQREILDPLGMERTTLEPAEPFARGWAVHPWVDAVLPEPFEDAGAMSSAGQLWSTINDMARWIRFINGDAGDVLHPDTVSEMCRPGSIDNAGEWNSGYGLGLQLMRSRSRFLAGHGGSIPGFQAAVLADPSESVGAVFMANSTAGVTSKFAIDLMDILYDLEPRIPQEWQPKFDVQQDLLELTGPWFWGPRPHVLRILRDGLLDLAPWNGSGRASRFRSNGDGTWTGLDGYYAGEVLSVGRAEDGTPTHLDISTFIFTRVPYDPNAPIPGGVLGWRLST